MTGARGECRWNPNHLFSQDGEDGIPNLGDMKGESVNDLWSCLLMQIQYSVFPSTSCLSSGASLHEWVQMEPTKREIFRRFKHFLKSTLDSKGENVHQRLIRDMAEQNGESLHVDFALLSTYAPEVAIFVTDVPTETLEVFDAAAKQVVLEQFPRTSKRRAMEDIAVLSPVFFLTTNLILRLQSTNASNPTFTSASPVCHCWSASATFARRTSTPSFACRVSSRAAPVSSRS